MNCPYCGAEKVDVFNRFACSTRQDSKSPTYICLKRQISQLKAELAKAKEMISEEAKLTQSVMDEAATLRNELVQCVRRDDPRLKIMLEGTKRSISGCDPAYVHDLMFTRNQLQSIIEGK